MIKVSMTLRHNDTGAPVYPGASVTDFRGDVAIVSDPVGQQPHKSSSTGRIHVEIGGNPRTFFPGVFGCRWHYDDPKAAVELGLYVPEDNIPPPAGGE
tara:strand:- start:333 stop:626 length:294 start_codon:yes stop_codon:yes gene_type:complete